MKGPYGSKEMVVEDGFLAGKGQLATLNLCSASNFKQLADHWNFNPQKSSKTIQPQNWFQNRDRKLNNCQARLEAPNTRRGPGISPT